MRIERGQGMVEMAVIAPLLIFIFIGLVEVGWAILGYMKLLNESRELARYAVRSDVSKGWPIDDNLTFTQVISHYQAINGNKESTIILHRYRIFTGDTCQGGVCYPDCGDPDTSDDESDFWVYTHGETRGSKINDNQAVSRLMAANFRLNCQKQLRYIKQCLGGNSLEDCKALARANVYTDQDADTVTVELFYDQPQILGFPVIDLADPVPLWVYTTMRIP